MDTEESLAVLFITLLAIVIFGVGFYYGHRTTKELMAEHCTKLGHVIVEDKMYTCEVKK